MKVMAINAVPYGSTGKIMFSISEMLLQQGNESLCASGFSWHRSNRKEQYLIGNVFSKSFHMYMAHLFGNHGCYSYFSTKRLIRKIEEFSPDVIHLHNIHGWYLHLSKFFEYLKDSRIPVIWTLHDCWALTGGCSHFTFCDCDKWLNGCGGCKNLDVYPISSKRDKTEKMWQMKRDCLCGLENMTIVTPSQWLANLVGKSYLREYPIHVIHNGIHLDIFKPRPSDFRKKYGIAENQHLILGVSLGWDERKGVDVFLDLAKMLPSTYRIVLVGTDKYIDNSLPKNIISIHRTQSAEALSEIYSAADLFVNPTREDNYPTVNMEALACGTPVLTFLTGGSAEIIDDSCGSVVAYGDIETLKQELIRICEEKPYPSAACLQKAKEFSSYDRFKEYLDLYERIITTRNTTN